MVERPETFKPKAIGPKDRRTRNPRLNTKFDRHPNLITVHRPPPPLKIRPKVEPPEEPEHEVVPGPRSTPESTDLELTSNPQSLSADSQPVDLQAAIYAAKGKTKQSHRISGGARGVGNAAEGVQPAERSLDPSGQYVPFLVPRSSSYPQPYS
jgi:hypothetical protein